MSSLLLHSLFTGNSTKEEDVVPETPVEQSAEVVEETAPEAPAVEEDDRDPMGTWRILDNPGKITLNIDVKLDELLLISSSLRLDSMIKWTIYREDGDQRGCRRLYHD